MKIDDIKSVSLLSCKDFCSMMEEDGITPAENDALMQHIARCPKCREEYELLRLMRGCAAVPPPDLTKNVMRLVRAEKAKAARRRTLSRAMGVACAAVILVPALTVLLPHLRTSSDESMQNAVDKTYCAQSGADASITNVLDADARETVSETGIDLLDSGLSAEDEPVHMPPKLPEEYYADDTPVSLSPLSTTSTSDGASDGIGDKTDDVSGTKNESKTESESPYDPSDETEPAFFDEIRAIVGEEAFDAWLAQYDGAPDEAERDAYMYFGIEQ